MDRPRFPALGPAARLLPILLIGGAVLASACGDDAVGPPVLDPVDLLLTVENLHPLDPETEGTYEGWVVDSEGTTRSAGRFAVTGPGETEVVLESPVRNPVEVYLSVQPPGESGSGPSDHRLIGGKVSGGAADLGHISYLTPGVPLVEEPGTHALFTPSDNAELGYPSNEDAGIWLFNIQPDSGVADSLNPHFFLKFTPLPRGWTYEGWVVRDFGSESAVWLSYGKFEVDGLPGPMHQRARFRTDTGLGPFSGRIDYVSAMEEEVTMPGGDWVANPLALPVPGGLDLPLDLNGCLGTESYCRDTGQEVGPSRYTHVITIEPARDRGEDPWHARPFFLRPYRNPIGEGGASTPRVIGFFPGDLPRGRAVLGSS